MYFKCKLKHIISSVKRIIWYIQSKYSHRKPKVSSSKRVSFTSRTPISSIRPISYNIPLHTSNQIHVIGAFQHISVKRILVIFHNTHHKSTPRSRSHQKRRIKSATANTFPYKILGQGRINHCQQTGHTNWWMKQWMVIKLFIARHRSLRETLWRDPRGALWTVWCKNGTTHNVMLLQKKLRKLPEPFKWTIVLWKNIQDTRYRVKTYLRIKIK